MWRAFVAVVCLSVLVMSGCAIKTRMYSEPTVGTTANVVFRNGAGGASSVFLYDDAAQCSRRWNTGTIGPNSEKKLKVKANQQLAFTFGYDAQQSYPRIVCNITASFAPTEGQTYEVLLSADTQKKQCYLEANQVDISGSGKREIVELKQRTWTNGFDENSNFCLPL